MAASSDSKPGSGSQAIIEEARRRQAQREKTYREKALKLFPWVCGRCGREFSGRRLSELTVHHKDHNHENNPPDGGNWELLCIYCHDQEHQRQQFESEYGQAEPAEEGNGGGIHRPFAGLEALLKKKS